MPSCVPLGGGGAERARPGEVRPERDQHSPERRMLGIVFVLAAVEQLDTGRQVLRLVPVLEYTRQLPAASAHARRMISVNASRPAAAERVLPNAASDLRSERGAASMMVLLALRSVEIMSIGTPTRLCRRSTVLGALSASPCVGGTPPWIRASPAAPRTPDRWPA